MLKALQQDPWWYQIASAIQQRHNAGTWSKLSKFYFFSQKINSKHDIVEKLTNKGVPNLATKFPNLHLLPIFQEKIAFGNKGFPLTLPGVRKEISYKKGICPVSESLVDNTFFQFYINEFDLSLENLDFIASSFEEVLLTLDFKQ